MFDDGLEAGFFVQVGLVYPVPGKVFHEDGGNAEFLAEDETEGGDVAEYQVGLRFLEGFTGVFEGRFIESKEAFELGDGSVEVVIEGGFLDESDVGFELMCMVGDFGGEVFRPEPVGQGAEYVYGQPGCDFGEGSQDGDRPGGVSESVGGCEAGDIRGTVGRLRFRRGVQGRRVIARRGQAYFPFSRQAGGRAFAESRGRD